jgi:hypothetical protein
MYIIHHTIKYQAGNRASYTDNYQLADTLEEAKAIARELVARLGDDLYCYSVAKVVEASEPHWVEKSDPAATLAPDAWGTDK